MPPSTCPDDPDEERRRAYEQLRLDCQTGLRAQLLQLRQSLREQGLL